MKNGCSKDMFLRVKSQQVNIIGPLSAVGTVRPDRLISARLRRKFSNFQQPSPIVLLPVVLPDITEYTVKQELPY